MIIKAFISEQYIFMISRIVTFTDHYNSYFFYFYFFSVVRKEQKDASEKWTITCVAYNLIFFISQFWELSSWLSSTYLLYFKFKFNLLRFERQLNDHLKKLKRSIRNRAKEVFQWEKNKRNIFFNLFSFPRFSWHRSLLKWGLFRCATTTTLVTKEISKNIIFRRTLKFSRAIDLHSK